jgi:hypothetical protein
VSWFSVLSGSDSRRSIRCSNTRDPHERPLSDEDEELDVQLDSICCSTAVTLTNALVGGQSFRQGDAKGVA